MLWTDILFCCSNFWKIYLKNFVSTITKELIKAHMSWSPNTEDLMINQTPRWLVWCSPHSLKPLHSPHALVFDSLLICFVQEKKGRKWRELGFSLFHSFTIIYNASFKWLAHLCSFSESLPLHICLTLSYFEWTLLVSHILEIFGWVGGWVCLRYYFDAILWIIFSWSGIQRCTIGSRT